MLTLCVRGAEIMNKTIENHIRQLKMSSSHPDIQGLAVCFEEFLALYERRHNLKGAEEFQGFVNELSESHRKFTGALGRACRHYNMTPDQFAEYLEDPKNFTTAQWEELQGIKREGLEMQPAKKSAPKNLSKTSKRI